MAQSCSRRKLFTMALAGLGSSMLNGCSNNFDPAAFFQKNFQEMSPAEKERTVQRLEKKYSTTCRRDIAVSAQPARENVVFGYGLDLSLCVG